MSEPERTIACDVDGCDFKAKTHGGLATHRSIKHGIRSQTPRARRHRGERARDNEPAPPTPGQQPLGLDDDLDGVTPERVPGIGTVPDASPDAPKRSLRDRLWGARDRVAPPAPRGPRRKRESTAELLGMLWGGGGWLAIKLGDAPVGRAMQFEMAAAGPILERATQDTPIDALLQPFARNAEAWKDAGALIALPLFIGLMERSPELAVTLEPLVRELIVTNAAAIVPVLEQRQAREAKNMAALESLGIGSVDQILEALFAMPPNAPAAGPEGPAATQPAPGNGAGVFTQA